MISIILWINLHNHIIIHVSTNLNLINIVLYFKALPLCNVPAISFGNMANDGGHLLLTPQERAALLQDEPAAQPYIRPYVGSDELINGIDRYCLWLVDVSAGQLRSGR